MVQRKKYPSAMYLLIVLLIITSAYAESEEEIEEASTEAIAFTVNIISDAMDLMPKNVTEQQKKNIAGDVLQLFDSLRGLEHYLHLKLKQRPDDEKLRELTKKFGEKCAKYKKVYGDDEVDDVNDKSKRKLTVLNGTIGLSTGPGAGVKYTSQLDLAYTLPERFKKLSERIRGKIESLQNTVT